MSKYNMKIDLNVLNHLGLNLYSNTPAVLSEVIANAWDADADRVDIQIDPENDLITITDNGKGMSLSDINEKYLLVGYQKRNNGEAFSAKYHRPVMGRKGIGKLSVFSIADKVRIYTTDGNDNNAFEMSRQSIQESINSTNNKYEPKEIEYREIGYTTGTRIEISQFKKNIKRTSEFLRTRLARRFSVMGDNFEISLDDKPITLSDREYFKTLQFIWPIGEFDTTILPDLENDVIQGALSGTIKDTEYKISGWIGAAKKPSDLGDNNRISITARGKLAQEDILASFSEGGIYASYLIGEIAAEFLDDDAKDDISTSNRQQYIEEEDRYIGLKCHINTLLKTIQAKWTDLRNEGATRNILDKYPKIKEWYEDIKPATQKYARKLFSTIDTMHFDGDEEKKKQLLRYGILAFERLHLSERLSAFESEDLIKDIVSFGEIFTDLQNIEATLYWEIAHERLKVIRALSESCDKNDKERVLQDYIFDNLWLLNPSWERPTSGSPRLEQSVTKEFKDVSAALTDEEKNGRIDIRYRNTSGAHVIIELKRYTPTYKVNIFDLMKQIDKYRNALKKCLIAAGKENETIDAICIIGENVLPDGMTLAEANQRIRDYGRILFYDQIINDALESYSEYLKNESQIGRLKEIIESI